MQQDDSLRRNEKRRGTFRFVPPVNLHGPRFRYAGNRINPDFRLVRDLGRIAGSTYLALLILFLVASAGAAQATPGGTRIYSMVPPSPADSVRKLIARGQPDVALAYAQRWSLESPGNTQALNSVALAAMAARRADLAVQAGEQSVMLDPSISSSHLVLGRAYFDQASAGNTAQARSAARLARQEFDQAIQLDSTNIEAYKYLFTFHLVAPTSVGASRASARRVAAQMYRRDPIQGTWAQLRVAATLGPDSAIRAVITRALPLAGSPADSTGLVMATLASTAASATGATSRENLVALVYQRFPDDPRVRFQRARLWVMVEEHLGEAQSLLEQYVASSQLPTWSPAPSIAQWYLARALEKQGKRADAIAAYERGSAMSPPCSECPGDARRLRALH
jgi:hypothetical protein